MTYQQFQKKSKLPKELKTKEIYLEWIGQFEYWYERHRYGEGDSVQYADSFWMDNGYRDKPPGSLG